MIKDNSGLACRNNRQPRKFSGFSKASEAGRRLLSVRDGHRDCVVVGAGRRRRLRWYAAENSGALSSAVAGRRDSVGADGNAPDRGPATVGIKRVVDGGA